MFANVEILKLVRDQYSEFLSVVFFHEGFSTLSHLTRSPIFGVEGKQAIFFPKQETYTPLMKHSAT